MSYLNINYSTLEDAWGSNFEKNKKKKHSDVCNVYNKRNSTKTLRPYKSFQDSSHIKPIYEDDNYTKYYGYKDGRPFSRKSNKLSKYKLKFPYKRPSISNHYISDEEDVDEEYINEEEENIYEESFEPIKPIIQSRNTFKRASANKQPTLIRTNFSYIDEEHNDNLTYKQPIVIEEENDDDDYIQEEVSSNLRKRVSPAFKQQTRRKRTPLTQPEEEDEDYFSNIHKNYESDEEFDTYLKKPVYDEDDDDDEYNKIMQSVYEEHTPKRRSKHIADEELEEEEDLDENFKIKTSKKKMKERVFLDLMLYTISGIILIFIMEQFIQIGMKIKTTI